MELGLIVKENKAFFIIHALLFFVGLFPLVRFEKVDLSLAINSFHRPWLDQFFRYVTYLGSIQFFIVFMVALAMMKQNARVLLGGVISFISVSVVIQAIRKFTFFDQWRPVTSISADVQMHLVEGIIHKTYWSFPSGHAGTIFAAACLVHLLVPQKPLWLSISLLCVSCVVAFSRVYLCQHFYRDVYVGALIGTVSTTIVYAILGRLQNPSWLDRSW